MTTLQDHRIPRDPVERVARAIYEADDPWHTAWPWPDLQSDQAGVDQYRRIALAAIAAMQDEAAPVAWMPVETAPRDGRGILVVDTTALIPEACCGYFYEGRWWLLESVDRSDKENDACPWLEPTHWMPLPAPPVDDSVATSNPVDDSETGNTSDKPDTTPAAHDITQADREAAAKAAVLVEMRDLIRAGRADHHAEPWAAHRNQAERDTVARIVAWLREESRLCDCFARSAAECACGAWDDYKTWPLSRVIDAIEAGEWHPGTVGRAG